MAIRQFEPAATAKLLYPWNGDFDLSQDFLREVFSQDGGERAAEAYAKLLGAYSPLSIKGKHATSGPPISKIHFGSELPRALEACWFAACLERTPRDYVGLPRLSALGRLKRQLRQLAKEIESVNDSVYGAPGHAFNEALASVIKHGTAGSVDIEASFGAFQRRLNLPKELEEYGDYLVTLRGRKRNLLVDQEVRLLDLVETRTRRPHLAECSDLLTATYAAVGLKARDVSEKVLYDRRDRYRKSGKVPAELNYTEILMALADALPVADAGPRTSR